MSDADDDREYEQVETLERWFAAPSPTAPTVERAGPHNAAFIDRAGKVQWKTVPDFRPSYLVPLGGPVTLAKTAAGLFQFKPIACARFDLSSVQDGIAFYRQARG